MKSKPGSRSSCSRGKVLSTDRSLATVEVNRSSMCDHCPESKSCIPRVESAAAIVTRADNDIGAKPGDLVELTIEEGVIFWGTFVIYLVPVLGLLVFVIGSNYLNGYLGWSLPEFWLSGGAGILGLIISLAAVRLLSTRWKYLAQSRPVIEKVLPPEED